MNENLRKSYRDFQGIKDHEMIPMPISEIKHQGKESDSLLSAIYTLDPVTKLPTGDISCYVSANTSPEVKKFILDNLMRDVSANAIDKIPDGLSDDDAFALTRQRGESREKYMDRLKKFMDDNIQAIQDLKDLQNDTKVAQSTD